MNKPTHGVLVFITSASSQDLDDLAHPRSYGYTSMLSMGVYRISTELQINYIYFIYFVYIYWPPQ